MKNKEFVVFGLGRFGKSVAITLAESGCEVLVVDNNEDKIHDIADIVTYAVKADVTDAETLSSLGIGNFDGAVIAIGEHLEASVLGTILVKEMGIPFVLAKVQTETQAKVLMKVGADKVVFPEKETGIRIANKLIHGNFFDAVELSSTYSLMEINSKAEWDGHTLKELDVRKKYDINVIGIKNDGKLNINPLPDQKLSRNDVLVVIGENEQLTKLQSEK
ncbi:MAG: TrkA family potassium uptake protein [Velocimicrobium sp.]